MKRIYTLLSIILVICLSLALVVGCQGQLETTPESIPSTPSPETPSVTSQEPSVPVTEPPPTPAPQEPAPELSPTPTTQQPEPEPSPSPTQPESTPGPTPEPTPETEIVEPSIHHCAFIKFDGIDGESQEAGHENWSEIVSFSQSMVQPSSGATGTTRRRGAVVVEDIVVVKQIDKATPKLAEAICKGTVFPKVEIHLTGPSEGSTCDGTFYAYELKNVMITSHKVTGSDPLAYALIATAPETTLPYSGSFIVQAVDAPMEEISLNFEEIKVIYTECDSKGKTKGNVEYSWKVEEGES